MSVARQEKEKDEEHCRPAAQNPSQGHSLKRGRLHAADLTSMSRPSQITETGNNLARNKLRCWRCAQQLQCLCAQQHLIIVVIIRTRLEWFSRSSFLLIDQGSANYSSGTLGCNERPTTHAGTCSTFLFEDGVWADHRYSLLLPNLYKLKAADPRLTSAAATAGHPCGRS